jgi:hypothetical protein
MLFNEDALGRSVLSEPPYDVNPMPERPRILHLLLEGLDSLD